ncbi:nitrate reductase gamma subunit NarI [Moraxella macacae 0408225]|uniref:nitrate reductase (quinone) n=1 Tax=Moraxella macacae 0408225 TaxID=1230338 RepID=L2F8C1_9GAMM|nr:respiratory nitrate reductase subunit gamma [Moraxella macacae]ELA09016.1 nitrate reductase gamma subunit NarI [Moraxella macacae 0408225]
MNTMIAENWWHVFLFGIYPYIALTVCVLGCVARFDLSQYTWRAGSSQMLSDNYMRTASNLFHIGIIVVLLGHFFGMFTPHFVYERFISAPQKQLVAVIVGGIAGILCLIGLIMLIWRRFTNPRISHTSTFADKMLLVVILVQLLMGLGTIWSYPHHKDGQLMLSLAGWAQSLAILRPVYAASLVENAGLIYKMHMFLGTTLILLVPFTRLIHIISAPIWYLGRRYQIVRQKTSQ